MDHAPLMGMRDASAACSPQVTAVAESTPRSRDLMIYSVFCPSISCIAK